MKVFFNCLVNAFLLLDGQILNVFSLIHCLIKLSLLGAPAEHLVLAGVCRDSYSHFALQSEHCSRFSGKQFGNVSEHS